MFYRAVGTSRQPRIGTPLPTPHHRRHFPYRIVRTFVRSFILASL